MRVIAGSARRLQLKTVPGNDTRPTTDRIKETLFNIISFDVENCRFLDLFAGSGGIGIEALSRGADKAVFVENNKKAVSCIRENLAHTHLDGRGTVMATDVRHALAMLSEPFDFIFMDPPYGKGLEEEVLRLLADSPACTDDTQIIVDSDLETSYDYVDQLPFVIAREKIYKTNKHTFMKRR